MKVRDERLDQVDFNHNWLKSRYLPALYRFLNLLRDEIEDPEFGTLFLTTHFRAWEHARGLVAELCHSFEREMSPRRLFDSPPLGHLDAETRSWLGDLLHHAWLTCFSVHDWVREGTSCTAAVEACYQTILPLLPPPASPVVLLYPSPRSSSNSASCANTWPGPSSGSRGRC